MTIEVGDIVASSGIFTVSASGSYNLECEPFPRRSEAVKQGGLSPGGLLSFLHIVSFGKTGMAWGLGRLSLGRDGVHDLAIKNEPEN